MTDETFPHEIWADLDHWIEGPAASDLRAQGYMKYIRQDVSDALIAAAYDAAARAAFRAGKSVHSGYRDENERIAQRIENELRLEVQAAIRGARKQGPQEALDALLKAERERALREAEELAARWHAEWFKDGNRGPVAADIRNLVRKDATDG